MIFMGLGGMPPPQSTSKLIDMPMYWMTTVCVVFEKTCQQLIIAVMPFGKKTVLNIFFPRRWEKKTFLSRRRRSQLSVGATMTELSIFALWA